MVTACPILMQQSPSENEKNVHLLRASPQTPTGALLLDPELNFTIRSTRLCLPLVYNVVYHLVLLEEGLLKRKYNAA
jgi:hypothetical protein